jgi:hypothetical protein
VIIDCSVANPRHFDADLDPDLDPAFRFDANPDPTFHIGADPDPVPNFQIKAQNLL